MATRPINRSTSEASIVFFGIVAFWPVYLLGGLYILGSVIGWLILALSVLRWYVEGPTSQDKIPVLVYLWLTGMLAMEIALLMGHANWSLGTGLTIKSSIGWAKGWALIALFIYLGAVLKIDFRLVVRAVCITSALAMPFFILGLFIYLIGGPEKLFVSPLKMIGGPGPEFFELRFFGLNPESGRPRWFFFTPWAPAAGLVSCLFIILCTIERDNFWRHAGMFGCLMICVLSQSRAGLAIMIVILPALFIYRQLGFGRAAVLLAFTLPVLFLLAYPLVDMLLDLVQGVKDSRPGSTRVRTALAEIALQRWQSEAPVWGHGVVERGPKIVEHMPIGTHHSWYGRLFTKGMVGAIALAVPMAMSLLYLVIEASRTRRGFIGFSLLLVLALYSFFENLEILVYLYWPALLYIGHAMQSAIKEEENLIVN